ncbi:MAG TPA: MFS transporter [Gemmatimonadales bacterium]|nr:MFS transporter [Gemmatimonadales bacterium]
MNRRVAEPAERRGPLMHYAWRVVAVTFLTLLVAAGIRSAPGVLMVPLEHEFGWTRSTISLAVSINLVLYGLLGPFAAALMDRFGIRRTVLAALGLLAVGVGLTPWMRASWQLIALWGVVAGIGTGMTALVLGATVVSRWFEARRGAVMGVLTASAATGQLVFLPLLASLTTREGWRSATLLLAGLALALMPVAALVLREFPRDRGLLPYGARVGPAGRWSAPDALSAENPARAALRALGDGVRDRDFWLLAGTFFICGATTNGLVGTHLIPACLDHGIPEVAAASLLATMGVFDLIGTTLSGWLSDRWDSRKLLGWYYGLRGLSLFGLPFALAGPASGRWAFAVFYGLDWVATVPPTVRLTGERFGAARTGVMFGWIVAAHQLGAGAAALGAGVARTRLGDYSAAFAGAGALCLLAAGLALGLSARGTGAARGSSPATAAVNAPA